MSILFLLYLILESYFISPTSQGCLQPSCVEPSTEYVDAELKRLNHNVNISTLLIIDQDTNDRCYEQKLIEIFKSTDNYRSEGSCSEDHQRTGPFILRTSCPWFPVANTDINRYPRTIFMAETHCFDCINSGDKCEPLVREVNVLSRNGSCNHNRVWDYVPVRFNVTIGFVCVKPLVYYG